MKKRSTSCLVDLGIHQSLHSRDVFVEPVESTFAFRRLLKPTKKNYSYITESFESTSCLFVDVRFSFVFKVNFIIVGSLGNVVSLVLP